MPAGGVTVTVRGLFDETVPDDKLKTGHGEAKPVGRGKGLTQPVGGGVFVEMISTCRFLVVLVWPSLTLKVQM